MQLWFKAWKDQDSSVRDYRPYFRPVLCYLEGAWTTKLSDTIEEPFFSDRHALDADTWFDLQEKVRFTGYTGRKSLNENFAYLPTALMNITERGEPVYAQWNYRMLCHPLREDLPTSHFTLVDDLSARLPRGKTLADYANTRSARFELVGPRENRFTSWSLLDRLMSEVPGKDNYPANLFETSFGLEFLDPVAKNNTLLNVGYYHRRYRVEKRDAMGLSQARRGFSDPNIFMAETTQSRIAPMYVRRCRRGTCADSLKRMSYAVPLEIVYLTPLTNWNPYNLKLYNSNEKSTVTGNGQRNGGLTKKLAYNGNHNGLFYRTPTEFFTGGEIEVDPADTVKGSVGVLDPQGNVRRVSSSGIRIFLPQIPGVGALRQRYPIVPVHGEGSPVWKELNAIKDLVMRLSKRFTDGDRATNSNGKNRGRGPKGNRRGGPGSATVFVYTTSTATSDPPGHHSHTVELTQRQLDKLKRGQTVETFTSEDNGHSHRVRVRYANDRLQLVACDGGNLPCWDGHTSCLMTETENSCPR
ncbi:hypothetical protein PoB_004192700 [Plakobranchus ocellatus]|uniref:Uncharacterized protein n=1 Tax=Plakobranchus ocellatus TaxID=259542 RepID=A0AAV4B8I4_9GAST|nr:hypothetical protein PoB_004192700 [Plakobranchus ocellatus]